MPQPVSHLATSSVAAADIAGRHLGGASGAQLTAAAHTAFTTAMATGMRVSAVVALVAAVGVAFALPARKRPDAMALPESAREPAREPAREDSPAPAAIIAG